LGDLFYDGRGVAQDYGRAREWYEKAADAGNASAMTNLGWLYEKGMGVTQDYSKAREWYQKAADAGNADAKEALAHLPQAAVQPTAQPTATVAISKTPSPEVANEPCQWWWGLTGEEVGQKL
jgi:TPR repeat protein